MYYVSDIGYKKIVLMEVSIVSELGDFLKRLRGSLSLREAARRSGLSYSYISSLEAGKHPKTGVPINPSPDKLKGLAKAYNYDFNKLMQKAGYVENEHKDNEDELLEGIDLELTDDELLDRFNISLDGKKLSEDESKEIIAYLRTRRALR